MNSELVCPWAAPLFFLYSTDSGIPGLLYYAYVPIVIATLGCSIVVVVSDARSLRSKILLLIALFFIGSILNNIFQWTSNNPYAQMFSWQINAFFELPIYLLSVYFLSQFFNNNKSTIMNYLLVLVYLSMIILLPTKLNILNFYITEDDCGGTIGVLWKYIYIVEILSMLVIASLSIREFISKKDTRSKLHNAILGIGSIVFLGIFFASNLFGDVTQIYQINLIGPIGMLIFIGVLSYIIVKYNTFNAKLFASQILILALLFFIASLLFIQQINIIRVVILFTFGLVSVLGAILIKSVQREIDQREKIEKLAVDLEAANVQLKELDRQKDELLGIVSHQLAAPVTSIKWYLEMLQDGDLGALQDTQRESISTMQNISVNLADLISMILDVSRIQLGRMKLTPQPLDLSQFFKEILDVIEPKAKEKKMNFEKNVPSKLPIAMLDKRYTRMTIENLLTNAIKYTPEKGTVQLKVELKDGKLRCEVKDTGYGIPKSEQEKIFGKLFRASNVRNTVDGNGFGLYVAKGAIEAQGGKIWFESEEGKGTTFFIDLPIQESKDVSVEASETVTIPTKKATKSAKRKS